MKSKLLIYALPALLVMSLLFGYSTQDNPTTDASPDLTVNRTQTPNFTKPILVSETDTLVPAGFPPTLWNYNYSTIPGQSGGTVGATYFQGKYYNNRWNAATLYRINDDGPNGGPGTLADSNAAYNGGSGAIRDMTVAPDGSGTEYLWGGTAGTALYKLDANGNRVATYTQAGAAYRTIAWDPNRKGFWSSNFSDNIVCRDTNGTILKTLTNALGGKYGLAFDSTSTADSAFLWVWNQQGTGLPNELHRIHIESNTDTRTYIVAQAGGTCGLAGGAETYVKDNKFILSLNYQNCAIVGYVLKELGPPPSSGNTLVLVHDSTISPTTQRTADRETLRSAVQNLVGDYTFATFTATDATLPDLTGYNTIILQETSFDNIAVRYLSQGARDQIKAWLDGGTAQSKRSLISIGADQGYNYSRTGSAAQDLVFAGDYCKFTYRVDNGPTSTNPSTFGTGTDAGNERELTSSPPGGSFWPDGCSMTAMGISLYRYQNHTANDTLAAIGNVQTNYVTATIFVDPRYYVSEFGDVLGSTINWVVTNGGVITGINSNSVEVNVPDSYNLSQNYPNPFNPTTKISFSIPKSQLVTLKIYNVLGKEVMTLVNEVKNAGTFEVQFDASNLSSGAYFYRLESGSFVSTKKMMLMK